MPHLSMNEVVFQLCQKVKNGTIYLTETQRNLNNVAVRALVEECVDSQKCQGSIDVAGYALHAHGKSITPETNRTTALTTDDDDALFGVEITPKVAKHNY